MAYTTTKTNWVAGDGFRVADINRIESNIDALRFDQKRDHKISGSFGGHGTVFDMPAGNEVAVQSIRLLVPAGKSAYLRRLNWNLGAVSNGSDLRLRIRF